MKIKAKIAALVAGNIPDTVQLQTGLVDENGNITQYFNVSVPEEEANAHWKNRDKPFTWTLTQE
jgi:hypothetical protein